MQIPQISEAEWEVMRIVWKSPSPLTAAQIIEQVGRSRTWNPKTVRTLITRLTQKNALGCNKESREYTYYSLVSEEECIQAESRSFLNRIFGGSLKPMMTHFLENEKLSEEDIQELKSLLQKKER